MLWEIDTTDVFGSGQSTSTGWTFDSAAGGELLVGSIGLADDPETLRRLDVADYTTAALDTETGETVWRREATSSFCGAAPSPDEDYLIGCRWGSAESEVQGDELVLTKDAPLSLVRLDPKTCGKRTCRTFQRAVLGRT